MALDGREKVFAAVGLLGLVIGVVALVLAISAKSGNTSDADVEAQVKQELNESIDSVKGTVTTEQGNARRTQRQNRNGINSNATGIASLKSQNKKLKKQVSSSEDDITKLEDEVKKLTTQVANLNDDQDKTTKQIQRLTDRVEDLTLNKKNK